MVTTQLPMKVRNYVQVWSIAWGADSSISNDITVKFKYDTRKWHHEIKKSNIHMKYGTVNTNPDEIFITLGTLQIEMLCSLIAYFSWNTEEYSPREITHKCSVCVMFAYQFTVNVFSLFSGKSTIRCWLNVGGCNECGVS